MGACQGINVLSPANQRAAAPPLRTSLYPRFCMKRGGGSEPPGRLGGEAGPEAAQAATGKPLYPPLPATGHTRLLEEVGKQHCCYMGFPPPPFFFFKFGVGLRLGEAMGRARVNGFSPAPTPICPCLLGRSIPPVARGPACAALSPSRPARIAEHMPPPASARIPGKRSPGQVLHSASPLPAAAGSRVCSANPRERLSLPAPCSVPAVAHRTKPFPPDCGIGGWGCPVQRRVTQMYKARQGPPLQGQGQGLGPRPNVARDPSAGSGGESGEGFRAGRREVLGHYK